MACHGQTDAKSIKNYSKSPLRNFQEHYLMRRLRFLAKQSTCHHNGWNILKDDLGIEFRQRHAQSNLYQLSEKSIEKAYKAGNYVSKKKYLLILEPAGENNVTPHQHQLLAGS